MKLYINPARMKKTRLSFCIAMAIAAQAGWAQTQSESAEESQVKLPSIDAPAVEEVVVQGVAGSGDDTAITIEREATSVVEAITADDFKKTGDSSASDALKRVTGVAVQGGQFAVVRGLQSRYVSTTLDGGFLPSTDPFRRDVPLDLFPTSVLKGINIGKSFTAKLPGTSSGGHVAMNLHELPTEDSQTMSVGVKYVDGSTGKDGLTYEGGDRDYLGFDDGKREMPDLLNTSTQYGTQKRPLCFEFLSLPGCLQQAELAALGRSLPAVYTPYAQRNKPGFSLAYSQAKVVPRDDGEWGFLGVMDYASSVKNRETSSYSDQSALGNNFERFKSEQTFQTVTDVDLTGLVVAGYTHDSGATFTSKTLLLRKTEDRVRQSTETDEQNGKVADKTTLRWVERELINQSFSAFAVVDEQHNGELSVTMSLGQTRRDEPDTRRYTYENDTVPASLITRNYAELDEDSQSLQVDYHVEVGTFVGADLTHETGFFVAEKSRSVRTARFGFEFSDTSLDRSLPLEALLSAANFDRGATSVTVEVIPTDSYQSDENQKALYWQTEADWNSAWILSLGGRYEKFRLETRYKTEEPSTTEEPSDKYDSRFLPAINLTAFVGDGWQWRLGYSRTLVQPGLVEISKSTQYDENDDLIIGNKDLDFSTLDNLDSKLEYYWDDEQFVSLGVFFKDIDKPIEKAIFEGTPIEDGYTFRNTKKAEVKGLEFDLQRLLWEGESWQWNYGVNLTYIDAIVTLDDTSAEIESRGERDLQGQSDYLANARLQLEHFPTGQSLSLVANYFDDRIDIVNNASRGDKIEKGRTLFDLVYRYEMENNWTIKTKIKNVLNEKQKYTIQGVSQRAAEVYSDGMAVSLDVDYTF
jgi:outer membrane receptor protein involved in Fe transport